MGLSRNFPRILSLAFRVNFPGNDKVKTAYVVLRAVALVMPRHFERVVNLGKHVLAGSSRNVSDFDLGCENLLYPETVHICEDDVPSEFVRTVGGPNAFEPQPPKQRDYSLVKKPAFLRFRQGRAS